MRPDSDLDLLVVESGPIYQRRLSQAIYTNLFGVRRAVDVLLAKNRIPSTREMILCEQAN